MFPTEAAAFLLLLDGGGLGKALYPYPEDSKPPLQGLTQKPYRAMLEQACTALYNVVDAAFLLYVVLYVVLG